MLTKPDIADELIISRLQDEYDLRVASLTFLPLGADMGSAVYRVVAEDGTVYFLKLRKGFNEIVVTVPLFLKSQGIKEIIAPFETKSNQGWADFGEYKMILYPFIEAKMDSRWNYPILTSRYSARRSKGFTLYKSHLNSKESFHKKRFPQNGVNV